MKQSANARSIFHLNPPEGLCMAKQAVTQHNCGGSCFISFDYFRIRTELLSLFLFLHCNQTYGRTYVIKINHVLLMGRKEMEKKEKEDSKERERKKKEKRKRKERRKKEES